MRTGHITISSLLGAIVGLWDMIVLMILIEPWGGRYDPNAFHMETLLIPGMVAGAALFGFIAYFNFRIAISALSWSLILGLTAGIFAAAIGADLLLFWGIGTVTGGLLFGLIAHRTSRLPRH
jgi:hypothetical protein